MTKYLGKVALRNTLQRELEIARKEHRHHYDQELRLRARLEVLTEMLKLVAPHPRPSSKAPPGSRLYQKPDKK